MLCKIARKTATNMCLQFKHVSMFMAVTIAETVTNIAFLITIPEQC